MHGCMGTWSRPENSLFFPSSLSFANMDADPIMGPPRGEEEKPRGEEGASMRRCSFPAICPDRIGGVLRIVTSLPL